MTSNHRLWRGLALIFVLSFGALDFIGALPLARLALRLLRRPVRLATAVGGMATGRA